VAGHGSSLLSKDGLVIAMFSFVHDDVRTGAEQLIEEMYGMGVNIEILSGDTASAVSAFGPLIGVPATACRGDMSPENKTKWVEARARTHVVMMAGDGFNDATAMAKADVGVAVGSGEQVNLDAADILIPGDDPLLITRFIALSRRTKRAVRQNLALSVLITIILVWSVLQGINDKLWIGVLVHEASVVLVILNGARIAGNDGMFTLLRNILLDLVVDFKLAVLAWKGQRLTALPVTRA
jgi:Cd2+/Zn2+-exporting ATPase